ncbi:MAG: sugar nucleotide-binding protein [Pirellulaceae bacterium]|nr:sugar nucleotide-binding protein [Pirellulaceae bacterium]
MIFQPTSRPPLPLLVTGIAGVAGYNALAYFQKRYPGQVIGVRRHDNWPLSGTGIEPCNTESYDELEALFEKYSFAAVLNCGGSCALKSCELDPFMAKRVNVQNIETLLGVLEKRPRVRLVHLSIDLVFSGNRSGEYHEDEPTDPVTIYGKTMVEAENLILNTRPEAAILRISLPMGISFNGHAGAIDWIQSRFQKNKPATLYYDEVRTPTYTECMNKVFSQVLSRGELKGLYHAGGKRKLSLYEIAQIVNVVGGFNPDNLIGCFRVEAGPIPPRAGNVTMQSNRLADDLGYEPFLPWPLDKRLLPTSQTWHDEMAGKIDGSPELLEKTLYNPAYIV